MQFQPQNIIQCSVCSSYWTVPAGAPMIQCGSCRQHLTIAPSSSPQSPPCHPPSKQQQPVNGVPVAQEYMDIWVVDESKSDAKCFKMTVSRSITLRAFTRALQHKTTYGINKSSMRLKTGWSPAGPWSTFFSFRFQTNEEKAMYDRLMTSLGVDHNSWFLVERVTSTGKMAVMGVAAAIALPITAVHLAAAAAAAGVVGVLATAAVLLTAKLAIGWAGGKAFRYVNMKMAPDLPPEILKLQRVFPAEGLEL